MYSNETPVTGIDFTNENTKPIAECVDKVCDLLLSQEALEETLKELDTLIAKTENYLNLKIKCEKNNNCLVEGYTHEVIEKLIDVKNILHHFGATMKPKVAEIEVRLWFETYIQNNNIKCINCNQWTNSTNKTTYSNTVSLASSKR